MLDRAVLLSYHILMIIKVSNKRSEARAFMQLVMVLKIESIQQVWYVGWTWIFSRKASVSVLGGSTQIQMPLPTLPFAWVVGTE